MSTRKLILSLIVVVLAVVGCSIFEQPEVTTQGTLNLSQLATIPTPAASDDIVMVRDTSAGVTYKSQLGSLFNGIDIDLGESDLDATNIDASGTLNADGATTLGSSLGVAGPTTVVTLTASGPVTFTDDMRVVGESIVVSLTATGPVSVTSLTVVNESDMRGDIANKHGDVTLADDVVITGTLDVAGATTLAAVTASGTISGAVGGSVAGGWTIDNGGLQVSAGDTNVVALNASGAVSVATTLGVVGATDLMGTVADSSGNLTLGDDVDVTGALDVAGPTTAVTITAAGPISIVANSDTLNPTLHIDDTDTSGGSKTPDIVFSSLGIQIAKIRANDALGLEFRGADDLVDMSINTDGVVSIAGDTDVVALNASGAVTLDDNLTFTGSGAGLQHGYVWGNEITWTQASAGLNTWYNISHAGIADGPLNGVGHSGSGALTVTVAGMYMADWAGDAEADAANQHIQVTLSVDGSATEFGQTHFETIAVNRESAISSMAILDLAAGQTVQVAIRTTDAGTPDLFVDHYHLRLVQIAGT